MSHPEGLSPLVILGDDSPEDGPEGVFGAGISQAEAWRHDTERLEAAGITMTPPTKKTKAEAGTLGAFYERLQAKASGPGTVIPETPPKAKRDDGGIVRVRTLMRTPPERRAQSEGLLVGGASASPRMQAGPSKGGEGVDHPQVCGKGVKGSAKGTPVITSSELLGGRGGGKGRILYQGSNPCPLGPAQVGSRAPREEAVPGGEVGGAP